MYPARNRLRHETEVKEVLMKGSSRSGKFVRAKIAKNAEGRTLVTVVVSKKTEKTAVGRNRIKRRVREVLREAITKKAISGKSVVILVNPAAKLAKFQEIREDVLRTLGYTQV
ncbi:MAG: ribonuclease P protein component [Patescibacteria group bacterium]